MNEEFSIISCAGEYTEPSEHIEILFRKSDGQICDNKYPITGDTDEYIVHFGALGAIMDICYFLSHGGTIVSISLPVNAEFDFEKKELIL